MWVRALAVKETSILRGRGPQETLVGERKGVGKELKSRRKVEL